MSRLQKLRRKWHYELNTPLCANCRNFKRPEVVLENSVPVGKTPALCKKGEFTVVPHACCDQWVGRKGERLL